MIQKNKTKIVVAFIVSCALALTAFAGTRVAGYGTDKLSAMNDANANAREVADERGTCYTKAKMSDCRQDGEGYWTCYAYVANHRGSCD